MWSSTSLTLLLRLRLPGAVLGDSILYGSRILVQLVFVLLMMSLLLPKCLAHRPELDLLPDKIAMTSPVVFGKIAHLLRVRFAELAKRCNVVYFATPCHSI